MQRGRSSQTAAFVATWRALGDCLPPELRLCHDPLGWSFSPRAVALLRPVAERFPAACGRVLLRSPLRRLVLWIQLRTRSIDDLLLEFVRGGGRQIVLLGAGFDSRPVRLAGEARGVRLFEVDHPATQARKRAILGARGTPANAALLAWDFERERLEDLPAALWRRGLDPAAPTFTIWEGVIPYLTEPAVEATLAAVRRFGAAGSRVVLHYIERQRIEAHTVWHVMAARVGEPLRFGWDAAALPGWLAARGWQLLSDRDDEALARALFGREWSFDGAGGRIALARPA